MAGEIIPFPSKPNDNEPMDSVDICTITITGKGDVFVWKSDYIEMPEQYNWLIAKVGEAVGGIIADKSEVINGP